MDRTFKALIALGVSWSAGAVLEVSAHEADVRKMVLDDIAEDGDKEFIDALGSGLPKSGLIKVHAELVGWPSEHEAGEYRLISATTVLAPELANAMAADVVASAATNREKTMAMYRKKPVVVEAMQFNGEWTGDATEILSWMGRGGEWDNESYELKIHTPEGTMVASKGDFIIKGVAGEFYPCKPDIFSATYDLVVGEPAK